MQKNVFPIETMVIKKKRKSLSTHIDSVQDTRAVGWLFNLLKYHNKYENDILWKSGSRGKRSYIIEIDWMEETIHNRNRSDGGNYVDMRGEKVMRSFHQRRGRNVSK